MTERRYLTPHLSDVDRPVVGKWYMVPCLLIERPARHGWITTNGQMPVIGPMHNDAEHLEFTPDHFHIDWRFLPPAQYRWLTDLRASTLGTVLTDDGTGVRNTISNKPAPHRMKCQREMPKFPDYNLLGPGLGKDQYQSSNRVRWSRLERAQAITCNKLKPGNICPHRGIDLTQFARPDGTAVCPGHGLHWNLATGELIPRFAGAHTNGGAA